MKLLRSMLFALTSVVAGLGPCHAQAPTFIWSEWETSAVQKHGPQQANGLLIYFHARSPDAPVAVLFTEMAKVARWDIQRINRFPAADEESLDDRILEVLAGHVARARQDGYKRIIVGGVSRGGWLALLSATVAGVDAAIGLAPGTTTLERSELERTRDVLVQKLAGAKAKRIAAFFFAGDPREEVEERRAVAIRRSLQGTQSAYMVVDRPADLYGHAAAGQGRLVRRYRDCLLQFVQNDDGPPGEVQCSGSAGYAVGTEIGFPVSVRPLKLPSDASPALASIWGRWEGDDQYGTYIILESDFARRMEIHFNVGYSPYAGAQGAKPWTSSIYFKLDEAAGILRDMFPADPDLYAILRPVSETELYFEYIANNGLETAPYREIRLRKRVEQDVRR